jgi:hypothetical protein
LHHYNKNGDIKNSPSKKKRKIEKISNENEDEIEEY